MPISYEQAGVSIARGNALVDRIKPLARSTRTPLVMDGIGGFAGLCAMPSDLEEPVLVAGTDGVGTKLKVAFAMNRHDTIGQDLVAMCVNDVLTVGARPLFFLDYFACSALNVDTASAVIKGIAEGCKLAECALLGGETAELPGMYADGEYDLAGFVVGVASKRRLLGPDRVTVGDELIAVASSGLHSNGFSLVHKVMEEQPGWELHQTLPELHHSIGEELLRPTRIYSAPVRLLMETLGDDLHALSHITGGGITENVPRMLQRGQVAHLKLDHQRPAIFNLLQERGPIAEEEMRRTFNLGIGLVVAVAPGKAQIACQALDHIDERAWVLGSVKSVAQDKNPYVEYV
jgi:phosphoribosylformylglycinamidine cyclo-ligase